MKTEKKWIRLGLQIERLHHLAMHIAMQSAALYDGEGIAVVADECRHIAERLYQWYDALEGEPTDGSQIEDLILELETLSANGSIEAWRIRHRKPLCVVFDEITNMVREIRPSLGLRAHVKAVTPAAFPQNPVSTSWMMFMLMQVGGEEYVENLQFTKEILFYPGGMIQDGVCRVRGNEIPVLGGISAAAQPQFLVLVSTDYEEKPRVYGLPVDTLPVIFGGRPGVSVQKQERLRECWSAEEGKTMRFLDYAKLV